MNCLPAGSNPGEHLQGGSRGSLRGKANASLEAEVAVVVQVSSWRQHSVLCLFPVMKCRLGSWAGLALGPYWKHPGVFLSDRLGLLTSFSLGIKGVGTVRCMWCVPQLVTLLHHLCTPGETEGGVLLSSEAGRGGSRQSDYATAWLPL